MLPTGSRRRFAPRLIDTAATIRLPAHMVSLLVKWRRAERVRVRELGRLPTFDEVASFLGLSEKQKSMVAKARQARQLNLESDSRGEATNWLCDAAPDRQSGEATLEADEERAIVSHRMGCLDRCERTVLALRYGLEGECLTFKEIGNRLGFSREWVREIERRSIRKLSTTCSDPPGGLRLGGWS